MRTITIDASVEVDLDDYTDEFLEDIDNDTLVDELCDRMTEIRSHKSPRTFTSEHEKKLRELLGPVMEELGLVNDIPNESVIDVLKLEHIKKIWDKYTLEQIEAALPE